MVFQDFKNFLKCVFPAKLLNEEIDLKESAKMTENDVAGITQKLYWKNELPTEGVSENICLRLEKGSLLWKIRFAPVSEDGLPTKSGHTIFIIDDETGQVSKEIVSHY